MTNAQMITAIENSIQTPANLTKLMIFMISNNLPNISTAQLQAICAQLGIATS